MTSPNTSSNRYCGPLSTLESAQTIAGILCVSLKGILALRLKIIVNMKNLISSIMKSIQLIIATNANGCGKQMSNLFNEEIPTINIDLSKVEYLLGVSYKDAIDVMTRNINALYEVIESLQKRVLELEKRLDE
jgi:hypothetical protein